MASPRSDWAPGLTEDYVRQVVQRAPRDQVFWVDLEHCRVGWRDFPGPKNTPYERDHARVRDAGGNGLYISLCFRQDPDDPSMYHVFVLDERKGWYHAGGFDTIEAARAWLTPEHIRALPD